MNINNNVVFGSDPEVFAVKEITENKTPDLVPPGYLRYAEGMVCLDESDKKHPLFLKKVPGVYNGWYQDGAAFETDIAPSKEATEFFDKYQKASEDLSKFLSDNFGLNLWKYAVARFDVKEYIKMGSEEIKNSCIAGCDPDFDATDLSGVSCPTRNLTEWKFRSAGGHLHMSIPGVNLHHIAVPLVRLLAITVGNYVVSTLTKPELEKQRRSQFGSACKYRTPIYPNGDRGVEYRSPNNEWLNDVSTIKNVFHLSRKVLDWVVNDPMLSNDLIQVYLKRSVNAIASVDQTESNEILNELQLI